MEKIAYVLPLMAGCMLLAVYGVSLVRRRFEYLKKHSIAGMHGLSKVFQGIFGFLPAQSAIRKFYELHMLKYSRLSFERLFEIKLYLFVLLMVFFIGMYFTNIRVFSLNVFQSFHYRVDMVYEYPTVKDEKLALKQELKYLKEAIDTIGLSVLEQTPEDIQHRIRSLVTEQRSELQEPVETLASKVYHRLKDYFEVRKLKIIPYLLLAFCFSFLPEFILGVLNRIRAGDTRRELVFLKKLIILNGSIPPIDFFSVLDILIGKARHYSRILEEIKEKNLSNSVNNCEIYALLISGTRNMEEKLFFEKLDEANNYSFTQAVKNIAYEFELGKRERRRHVEKQIARIKIHGMIGISILFMIIFIQIIMPWLNMQNIADIGF